MKNWTLKDYLNAVRHHSNPLSVDKYIRVVAEVLNKTNFALDDLMKKCDDPRLVRAQAFQMKIGMAIAQYAIGAITKNDLLNAVDDLQDYIRTLTDSPRVEESLKRLIKGVNESVNNLIEDRENLAAFEKSIHERLAAGVSPSDFAKEVGIDLSEESEGVRAMISHMLGHEIDDEELEELHDGDHSTRQVGTTQDGDRIMETRVKLPIKIGTPIKAGGITGRLASYFVEELVGGINDNTHVLVQVSTSEGNFDVYRESRGELLSHAEDLSPEITYCKVLLKDVRSLYN